jgi:hypothetical protein
MKLIEKLATAKKEIKETKVKKEGHNKFSGYDYFTPTQIELLVQQVCYKNRLLTKFDLIRNELGVYGRLTIFDLDSTEKLEYDMATAIPEIKATNIAQQLGGCSTYTERYLKTSAFGITDNNLDFDADLSKEQSKEPTQSAPQSSQPEPEKWLNKYTDKSNTAITAEFNNAVKALKEGKTITDIRKHYKVSKAVETELNAAING